MSQLSHHYMIITNFDEVDLYWQCEVKVPVASDSLHPVDCSPWNSPGQNTGVGSCFLLQGILPTQGSNPGLQHCGQILYQLSHQGKPKNTGVGSLSLFQRIFPTQELNWGLMRCRRILYQLSYPGSPTVGGVAEERVKRD